VVVFSAIALAVIPTLFVGDFQKWLYRALVFLVISCPCALVISVPLAFFSGIGALAKRGVMVKGGNYLQALSEADSMAFDKTGALTKGTFTVTRTIPYQGFTMEQVLSYASSVESESNHPIARAIHAVLPDQKPAEGAHELSGKGIIGMWTDTRWPAQREIARRPRRGDPEP
jgi:Cd2+/Zn2+-exporting ATPase